MREHAARRRHAVDLREIAGAGVDEFLRNHAVAYYSFVRVNVPQIGVQRIHTLFETGFELVELIGADDARNRIVGKQLVVVFAVLIDAEAHAIARQFTIEGVTPVDQFVRQLLRR